MARDFDRMGASTGRRYRRPGSRLFTLFHKRQFDYTFQGTSSIDEVIERALFVAPFFYHTLMVRVHNVDIANAGDIFRISVGNTLPSPEDPREFMGAVALEVEVESNQLGELKLETTSNRGPYFKVWLEAAKGVAGARMYAELSAVLFSRGA